MNIILGWLAWFRGSLVAQIGAGALAFLAAWQVNNYIERGKGRNQVVQASKEAGAQRNEKVRQIRRRIDPSDAWERLRNEYASGE